MKSLLRTAAVLALAGGLLSSPAAAAAPDVPHDGMHLGHPRPVREAAKREAVEFFSYDCYHSQQLELPLERWAERHRGDVVLRRVPAVWAGSPDEQVQLGHARLYYTLERLGQVDRLQAEVFRSVREQHADLTSEDRAADWAQLHGVDAAGFREAYRSAEVQRAAQDASGLLIRYRVDELPTVVVQDRYRTAPSKAGGVEQMPAELDRLVEQS